MKTEFLLYILILCLCKINGFVLPPKTTRSYFSSSFLRSNLVDVGDVILAEVDDFGGTVNNPTVSFKVLGADGPFTVDMPTKRLSTTEKLALQAGSLMKVVVTKVDGRMIHRSILSAIYILYIFFQYV